MSLPFQQIDAIHFIEKRYESPNTLVFLGIDRRSAKPLFVKLLKPHLQHHDNLLQRFRKEAATCARLNHPHIVKLERYGSAGEYHYLALDWVDGQNLKEFLSQRHPFPLNIFAVIARQLADALQYAHQLGIVHRDIKPANILINRSGVVQLTDFGLARITGDTDLTRQDAMVGSPAYMSPEQITGEPLDGRSDLFSLGSVLYELLTGKQAFGGDNFSACLHKIINEAPIGISEIRPEIPPQLTQVIETLLAKDPTARYPDAATVRTELEKILPVPATSDYAAFIRDHFRNIPSTLPAETPAIRDLRGRVPLKRTAWIGFAFLAIFTLAWMFRPTQTESPTAASPANINAEQSIPDTQARPTLTALATQDNADSLPGNREPSRTTARQGGDAPLTDKLQDATAGGAPTVTSDPPAEQPLLTKDATGELRIRVSPWARIEIDGAAVDTKSTALDLRLAPGDHYVTLMHPHFPPHAQKIAVVSGESRELSWSFLDMAGYLWIEVRPWAEIYIDGTLRDSSPLKKPLLLPIGEYALELRHPQLANLRETVRITPGDTLRLQRVLEK